MYTTLSLQLHFHDFNALSIYFINPIISNSLLTSCHLNDHFLEHQLGAAIIPLIVVKFIVHCYNSLFYFLTTSYLQSYLLFSLNQQSLVKFWVDPGKTLRMPEKILRGPWKFSRLETSCSIFSNANIFFLFYWFICNLHIVISRTLMIYRGGFKKIS